MINFHTATFIKSAFSEEDHLNDLPQILFIGKSNVGKSSLINALTNKKNLAYVSKTPGQTKLVNYYLIDNKFYLVDVPGFGYRKLAFEKDDFEPMMNSYFSSNPNLKMVFYLLDSRREITDDELDVIDYIKGLGFNVSIIFTKCDKLKQTDKAKLIKQVNKNKISDYSFVSINNNNYLSDIKSKISSIIE